MNEISCRIVVTLLRFVRNSRPELISPLLEGLPFDEKYLIDTENWVGYETMVILEDRMAGFYGDDRIMVSVGKKLLSDKSLGIIGSLFKMLGGPQQLIKYAPKLAGYFSRNFISINVLETTPVNALIEIKAMGGYTRGTCLFNQGVLSSVPELFGLEAAEIIERQCIVSADETGEPDSEKYCLSNNGDVMESLGGKTGVDVSRNIGEKGRFKFNGTIFGADSCIFELRWSGKRVAGTTRVKNKIIKGAQASLEANETFLKEVNDRLSRSEEKYRNLMEYAGDVIIFIDSAGIITSVNKKGYELSGFKSGDIIGRHFLDFVEEHYKDHAISEFVKALKSPQEELVEVVINTPNGQLFLSVNSSMVRESGDTVGLMLIARDITKEREYAARLIQAENFAAKGLVAAEIAHEINNALANIETALFIVNNIQTGEDYKRQIMKDINEEIERMSGIVTDILDVYRSEDPAIQAVDINEEISKVINITKRRLRGKAVTISSKLEKGLPLISCCPGHMKQILLNFIKNAEEAMASTKIKSILISTENDGRAVRISVKDSGCGMSSEVLANLFTPRFTSKANGSGFGLSICKQILEKYKGEIKVVSQAGSGTTVTVILPVGGHV